MRILITGGNGFIGRETSRQLLALGHSVTSLDIAGAPVAGVMQHQGDVRDRLDVLGAAAGSERVIHLASKVGIGHYLFEHTTTWETILLGTKHVVEACIHWGIPLTMTSSSEVYGKGHPSRVMGEDSDLVFGPTTKTRWVYGMSKALAEQIIVTHCADGLLDARIIRPFNVVGPGQDPDSGLVFASFAHAVARDLPLVVHGTGHQTRTFCDVRDFARGLIEIALLTDPVRSQPMILNMGGSERISIEHLAQTFQRIGREVFQRESEIETVSYRSAYGTRFEDTQQRRPIYTAILTLTGWTPTIPLRTMIIDTIRDAIARVAQDAARLAITH
jgi:UDP-glucose 4-epimerase